MNNSKFTIEDVLDSTDIKPALRQREEELVKLIDALDHIRASNYWIIIKRKFDEDLSKLINQLKTEKDPTEIFRLQGQITRAEKLDLDKTAEEHRNELSGLRRKLNE